MFEFWQHLHICKDSATQFATCCIGFCTLLRMLKIVNLPSRQRQLQMLKRSGFLAEMPHACVCTCLHTSPFRSGLIRAAVYKKVRQTASKSMLQKCSGICTALKLITGLQEVTELTLSLISCCSRVCDKCSCNACLEHRTLFHSAAQAQLPISVNN